MAYYIFESIGQSLRAAVLYLDEAGELFEVATRKGLECYLPSLPGMRQYGIGRRLLLKGVQDVVSHVQQLHPVGDKFTTLSLWISRALRHQFGGCPLNTSTYHRLVCRYDSKTTASVPKDE